MVTLAEPTVAGHADHRDHLLAREEAEHWPLEALCRHPEGSLNDVQRRDDAVRCDLEKRPQGGEPSVAAAYSVMALMLEMIEEVQDQLWCNVGQLHRRRRLGMSRLDKAEEQHERVPIRRHRARAQCPLLGEVFGKERLHECREGGNGYGPRDATHRALLALRRSVRT